MDAEVIVVGAGPAGAHLARRLAEGGREVLVLDRSRFPRDKVCGGGVSLKAARLLGGLPAGLIRHTITGALISHRNLCHVEVALGRPAGFTVTRRELDHWLVERARSAGAVIREGVTYHHHCRRGETVWVESSAGRLRCRLLVGADGAASRVRRTLTGRAARRLRPGVEALVPRHNGLEDRAVFDLGAVAGGYGWIFPKGDHLNVGVFSGKGPRVGNAQLDDFMAHYGLKGRVMERFGYPIPLDGGEGPWEGEGAWLVGDAAGFAEPMLGEGIYHALWSGELAARLILAGQTSPGVYSRAVRRHLVRELRAAARLADWLFPLAHSVVRRWARRPRFSARFAALMTGELGFCQCWRATWLGLPSLVLTPPRLPLGGPLGLQPAG